MSQPARNKHGRFVKIMQSLEKEERQFQVTRLKDLKAVTPVGGEEQLLSDDSEYKPAKHARTTPMAFKTSSQKKLKSTQTSISNFLTPIKPKSEPDSFSPLSLFFAPNDPAPPQKQAPEEQDTPQKTSILEEEKQVNSAKEDDVSGSDEKPRESVVAVSRRRNENLLFPDVQHRQGNLEYDRPVKVIGLRESEGMTEYAVLFAPSFGKCPDATVVSHKELVTKAPWLLANFILSADSY